MRFGYPGMESANAIPKSPRMRQERILGAFMNHPAELKAAIYSKAARLGLLNEARRVPDRCNFALLAHRYRIPAHDPMVLGEDR